MLTTTPSSVMFICRHLLSFISYSTLSLLFRLGFLLASYTKALNVPKQIISFIICPFSLFFLNCLPISLSQHQIGSSLTSSNCLMIPEIFSFLGVQMQCFSYPQTIRQQFTQKPRPCNVKFCSLCLFSKMPPTRSWSPVQ